MTASKNPQRARDDGNHCFVCGPDNPAGMQIRFEMDGELCRAEYTPNAHQCGYDGVVHGGILFSLLDDVMANWLFLQGERAYTARCEIRFRAPAPIGVRLLLEGELLERRGRRAFLAGRVRLASDATLLAEADAVFIVIADTDSGDKKTR